MNLPNKLTVLRVLLIPLFLALFFLAYPSHGDVGRWAYGSFWALLIFILASVTDTLDGQIARNRGLVTDFGKLMDPLADKLLVMAAMICLITVDLVHPVIVILIIAREFLVTSIRLVAASRGEVLAADGWGKAKTVAQMTWICYALLLLSLPAFGVMVHPVLEWINVVLVVVVAALTVISGLRYTWKNRALFADA